MARKSAVKSRAATAARPRGRPRSSAARSAILDAARGLLHEGGLGAVTVERIAERAGVGKPTIYRSWPNAHAVAMAALLDTAPTDATGPDRARSPLAALRIQLQNIVEVFASPPGRSVAHILAAAETETELSKAFRHHFILARRQEGRALLAAAIAAGEIRSGIDLEVALDLLYAPIFYRLLVGHAPLDKRFTDAVLRHVVRGLQ